MDNDNIPSIEFLATHGIVVTKRVELTYIDDVITSRGVEILGTIKVTRDYITYTDEKYKSRLYWFYNPVGRNDKGDWGENPHNPFNTK